MCYIIQLVNDSREHLRVPLAERVSEVIPYASGSNAGARGTEPVRTKRISNPNITDRIYNNLPSTISFIM